MTRKLAIAQRYPSPVTLEEAWEVLHDATPPGWFVGRPGLNERGAVPWEQYAFDTTERPRAGHRSREWTAIGITGCASTSVKACCGECAGEAEVAARTLLFRRDLSATGSFHDGVRWCDRGAVTPIRETASHYQLM